MQDNAPERQRESERTGRAGQGEEFAGASHTDRQTLLAITELIAGDQPLPDLFTGAAPLLRELTNCDVLNFALYDPKRNAFIARFWEKDQRTLEREKSPVADLPCHWVWQHQKPVFISDLQRETRFRDIFPELSGFGVRSYASFPLSTSDSHYGALGFGSRTPGWEGERDPGFLSSLARLMAVAVESRDLRRELRQTRSHQQKDAHSQLQKRPLDAIIGNSPALKAVLDAASVVAQTDATVLITGETGTGKERVARAIHLMSRRKDNAFIKLNCAAIPTGLLESELFGHEKGAFTGAVSQKIGRLELADKGTLLLDEVGDIPLELQPKLLRVLQDQEFERLGGTKTIKVDVRILAATNKDLEQAVEEKHFRSDLFYRLHVFPLHLPALQERREDIPLLVRHFVRKYGARLNKQIQIIPDEAVEVMMNYGWPGNIRELENFIERSVILSEGNRLQPPLAELRTSTSVKRSGAHETLRDRERTHIIEILRQTGGVLSGPGGAASRLGLKRTTLQYKLQKLGISRHEYLD
jgi:formate hydrogenlyase transcriptional activator